MKLKSAIKRLSIYLRVLKSVQNEGIQLISSKELGLRANLSSTQVRKDLSTFGRFGLKGVGYYTSQLIEHIERVLNLKEEQSIAIIGAGYLGSALANYKFEGFKVEAIFDNDKRVIGSQINGIEISDVKSIKTIIRNREIEIGVISVPNESAQVIANKLVEAEVKGIWNFSAIKLQVPDEIRVIDEDLSLNLNLLSNMIKE